MAVGDAVLAVITLAIEDDGEEGLRSMLVETFFSSICVSSAMLDS